MPSDHPCRPFFVAGPTGSGKTALALALAERFPVEIVNADAFQLYRGLATLTACPAPSEQTVCPHHLYAQLDPSESCDAGRYLSLANPLLAGIAQRGRIPLVTGGSGLYLKALSHGLDESLPTDPAVRAALNQLDLDQIRDRLKELDPAALDRIDPHNRRYLQRALEISLATRQPASQLRKAWTSDPPGLRGIVLERPRQELCDRIERRVLAMIEQGALAEVAAIASWSPTSSQAIGVREIQAHLRGEISLETCILLIQQATRRYARRQATWFRRETWLRRIVPPSGDDWAAITRELDLLVETI